MTSFKFGEKLSRKPSLNTRLEELLLQIGISDSSEELGDQSEEAAQTEIPALQDLPSIALENGWVEVCGENGIVAIHELKQVEKDSFKSAVFVPRTRQRNVPKSRVAYKSHARHMRRLRNLRP